MALEPLMLVANIVLAIQQRKHLMISAATATGIQAELEEQDKPTPYGISSTLPRELSSSPSESMILIIDLAL